MNTTPHKLLQLPCVLLHVVLELLQLFPLQFEPGFEAFRSGLELRMPSRAFRRGFVESSRERGSLFREIRGDDEDFVGIFLVFPRNPEKCMEHFKNVIINLFR